MVNYPIDPLMLEEFVPAGTELDFYNGQTYVSLIGFLFLDTRIFGFGIPYHINFEEVNLRLYVKRYRNGKLHRGVSFIRELVPRSAIVFVANNFYGEKYKAVKMRNTASRQNDLLKTEYSWLVKGKWNKIAAQCHQESVALQPGSEEEFIAEHYWGFTRLSPQRTSAYELYHPKWEIYPVREYSVDCDFGDCFGEKFHFLENRKPSSVFMAKGSDVKIFYKQKIII